MKLRNCIYRFLNKEGEIIYIGKTKNLKHRLAQHEHLPKECYEEKTRVEFLIFKNEDDMDFAERYFIPKYKPKYNTVWSERELSINIPDLDDKTWLEYGKMDFIVSQIESLSLEERKTMSFFLPHDKELERKNKLAEVQKQIDELKKKIVVLKKQQEELACQKDSLIRKKQESLEVEQLKKQGYEYVTLDDKGVLTMRKINHEGRISYKDQIQVDCFDTKDAQMIATSESVISDCLSECEGQLKIRLNERLRLVLGEDFNKMSRYDKIQMIKHETFSIEDTLKIKIEELIDRSLSSCKSEIKQKGYYYRSKLLATVYHSLSYCPFSEERFWVKWIDDKVEYERGELRRTDKIRKKADEIINEIDGLLERDYGVFKESVIIENLEYPIIGEKIPQASIVRTPYSENC